MNAKQISKDKALFLVSTYWKQLIISEYHGIIARASEEERKDGYKVYAIEIFQQCCIPNLEQTIKRAITKTNPKGAKIAYKVSYNPPSARQPSDSDLLKWLAD